MVSALGGTCFLLSTIKNNVLFLCGFQRGRYSSHPFDGSESIHRGRGEKAHQSTDATGAKMRTITFCDWKFRSEQRIPKQCATVGELQCCVFGFFSFTGTLRDTEEQTLKILAILQDSNQHWKIRGVIFATAALLVSSIAWLLNYKYKWFNSNWLSRVRATLWFAYDCFYFVPKIARCSSPSLVALFVLH